MTSESSQNVSNSDKVLATSPNPQGFHQPGEFTTCGNYPVSSVRSGYVITADTVHAGKECPVGNAQSGLAQTTGIVLPGSIQSAGFARFGDGITTSTVSTDMNTSSILRPGETLTLENTIPGEKKAGLHSESFTATRLLPGMTGSDILPGSSFSTGEISKQLLEEILPGKSLPIQTTTLGLPGEFVSRGFVSPGGKFTTGNTKTSYHATYTRSDPVDLAVHDSRPSPSQSSQNLDLTGRLPNDVLADLLSAGTVFFDRNTGAFRLKHTSETSDGHSR